MMRAIPVRIDDRDWASVSEPTPQLPLETTLAAGLLFWMTLSALAIITALL